MIRAATRQGLRAALTTPLAEGRRVALVPTMGYLHEGHLSLCDHARRAADCVVMSLFVNPLQFGPGEDFTAYPRDEERDAVLAAERGVDILFAPSAEEMYPLGPAVVRVGAPGLEARLCGAYRPGHFAGVLTVVAKLFHIVAPHAAIFGRKDAQQALLIRRMALDLEFPVEVLTAPIVREPDGLAMSSRNAYLSGEERRSATALYRGLVAAHRAFGDGERAGGRLEAVAAAVLASSPGVVPQYVEAVDPVTLQRVPQAEPGTLLAVAAHAGGTRLIDNWILGEDAPSPTAASALETQS